MYEWQYIGKAQPWKRAASTTAWMGVMGRDGIHQKMCIYIYSQGKGIWKNLTTDVAPLARPPWVPSDDDGGTATVDGLFAGVLSGRRRNTNCYIFIFIYRMVRGVCGEAWRSVEMPKRKGWECNVYRILIYNFAFIFSFLTLLYLMAVIYTL